jgi:hypothetical protein
MQPANHLPHAHFWLSQWENGLADKQESSIGRIESLELGIGSLPISQ